ncbi:MAG TPA: HEPN domain-containing protein, partial [Chloroflexi bacterium]|nr:HEPN domain-containing protein [Chloroflexota bacterium]
SNLDQGFYAVAVTRAYYAMFYAASALLASKGITRSKHSAVLAAFGEQFAKPGLIEANYAKAFGHAFDARLDSDYDITFAADEALAREVLLDARRFVERVAQFLDEVGAP